jgi:hypothetical protein
MSTSEHDPKRIFGEALGLTEPGLRAAYLDGACGRATTLWRKTSDPSSQTSQQRNITS